MVCLCNLSKFNYTCSEGRERERSADFIHCPQDEFMALSEREMEDMTLLFSVISVLSYTNVSILLPAVSVVFIFEHALNTFF